MDFLGVQSIPTIIPENEIVSDVDKPEKSNSRRKSKSPKKVIFEYFNINLTNESLNLPFLITVTFVIFRYQAIKEKPSQPRTSRRIRGSREEQVIRR